MVWLGLVIAALPAVAQPRASASAAAERAAVVAALERLRVAGEPRHTSHDDGEWLQRQVDAAIARQDREIERLAQRAATPLLARVTSPVSATNNLPTLSIEMQKILEVARPHGYTARISASLDGGQLVSLGAFSQGSGVSIGRLLPDGAARPGLHHVRLRAELTFEPASGLEPETRDLPEIVYALYDPQARAPFDARMFVENAAVATARRLDGSLPAVPFEPWLTGLVAPHGGSVPPMTQWRTAWCDERLIDGGAPARTRDICAVADFATGHAIGSGTGHAWIRTGHVDFSETEVRWLTVTPAFEGLIVHGVELDELSSLPGFLMDPAAWPVGDLVMTPEEVTVAAGKGNTLQVEATVKNVGNATLRGVIVHAVLTADGRDSVKRAVVVDVPRNGTTKVTIDLPLLTRYAVVLVHALQVSEHTAFGMWTPDPTPENAMAFRIVNPRLAPRDYAAWVGQQCGPCRGF